MSDYPSKEPRFQDPESLEGFGITQLQDLLTQADIGRRVKDPIIEYFPNASDRQKLWLKQRLETIINTRSEGKIKESNTFRKNLTIDWVTQKSIY